MLLGILGSIVLVFAVIGLIIAVITGVAVLSIKIALPLIAAYIIYRVVKAAIFERGGRE